MISDNIKELRKQKGLTQKELADLLHVTPQAVSRWEKGEVEPSVETISNMAKIFEATTDEIIDGPDKKPKVEIEVVREVEEKVVVEQAKPVLTICSQCKKPLYTKEEIVTKTLYHEGLTIPTYICVDCDKKNRENEYQKSVNFGNKQRRKSYIWGTVFGLILLVLCIPSIFSEKATALDIVLAILIPIFTFTFASCIYLKNNFIEDVFLTVTSWGFIRLPGVIFSFSLDGLIFLVVVKIFLWLLSYVLGFFTMLIALFICLPLSLVAYPFALIKSIRSPELSEDI